MGKSERDTNWRSGKVGKAKSEKKTDGPRIED